LDRPEEGEIIAGPIGVAVGDAVVYAGHGVGRVIAREQTRVAGTERDCIVVELAAGLRVTLPIEEATERLRPVAGSVEIDDIRRTLGSEASLRDGPWTRRITENKAKLASGRPIELAELVRDGSRIDQPASRQRLPHTERRVYLQARELLVRELCSARGIEPDAADAWIEAQITPPDERA
jgi:CarD family transcriptional regulator